MSRNKYTYTMIKSGKIYSCNSICDLVILLNSKFNTDIYTNDKLRNYFTRRQKNPKGFKNINLTRQLKLIN